jgi:hypothetical protein
MRETGSPDATLLRGLADDLAMQLPELRPLVGLPRYSRHLPSAEAFTQIAYFLLPSILAGVLSNYLWAGLVRGWQTVVPGAADPEGELRQMVSMLADKLNAAVAPVAPDPSATDVAKISRIEFIESALRGPLSEVLGARGIPPGDVHAVCQRLAAELSDALPATIQPEPLENDTDANSEPVA